MKKCAQKVTDPPISILNWTSQGTQGTQGTEGQGMSGQGPKYLGPFHRIFKCRSTGNYGFPSMGFLRSSLQNRFWTSLSLDKLTPLFLYIVFLMIFPSTLDVFLSFVNGVPSGTLPWNGKATHLDILEEYGHES